MVRLCADTKKAVINGYVFYNSAEQGFDTYPATKSEIALQGAYIQLGFSSGGADEEHYKECMFANQIFGLAPCNAWKICRLSVPKATYKCGLRMIDVFDWGTKGVDWDEKWSLYFDRTSGWFCGGNPNIKGAVIVNFIENALAVLNSQGVLKALWIKPVFKAE